MHAAVIHVLEPLCPSIFTDFSFGFDPILSQHAQASWQRSQLISGLMPGRWVKTLLSKLLLFGGIDGEISEDEIPGYKPDGN